jgi:3-hydroxyisobutyrate dehydrogenase
MKILWIGTGVMGGPMVGHLVEAGHDVRVHTRTRAKADDVLRKGAVWADRPADAAAEAELVCTMVGYPRDVEACILGTDGVLTQMQPGAGLIDFTTSSPVLARRIWSAASTRGVRALDAPVSGGDVGARQATLSIMAGGDPAAFEEFRPVLDILGQTVVLQGPAGSGQHTKMVNQILVASGMIGVCEAILYARRAGLEPDAVLQSVGGGAASSWALNNLAPRILRNDFAPGFFVEHFVKDMGIALEECRRMNLSLPGLELAHRLYQQVVAMGLRRNGTQALYHALEQGPPPSP